MKNKKYFIVIMLLSLLVLSNVSVVPIVASIMKSFSNVSNTKIQLIVTLIPLSSIITMFMANTLCEKIGMKKAAIIGLLLIMSGAIVPLIISTNLLLLYLSSILIGLGMGLVAVVSSTMVSFYSEDCMKIMGYQSIFVSLGGTLISTLSGLFSHTYWPYAYFCFAITIPILILVSMVLPNDYLKSKSKVLKVIPKRLILLGFLSIIFFISLNTFNTSISILCDFNGFSTYESSIATSIWTITGILIGLNIKKISNILKKKTLIFVSIIAFIGLLILGFTKNIYVIYLSSFILGCAFSIRNPYGLALSSSMVDSGSSALAIAIFSACGQIGSFISPYIINALTSVVNGGIRESFIVASIIMLVSVILNVLFNPSKEN